MQSNVTSLRPNLPANAISAPAKPPSLPEPLVHLAVERTFSASAPWRPPPSLRPEIATLLPAAIADYERSSQPAPTMAVRDLLLRLAINCALQDMPENVWAVHLEDFVADLSDIPLDLIADGCKQWRRQSKFFPAISEFLALVQPQAQKRRAELERLRILQRAAVHPAPNGVVTTEWYLSLRRGDAALAALPPPEKSNAYDRPSPELVAAIQAMSNYQRMRLIGRINQVGVQMGKGEILAKFLVDLPGVVAWAANYYKVPLIDTENADAENAEKAPDPPRRGEGFMPVSAVLSATSDIGP